ncbi:conserved hypothetical protein [Trichinella spiralis]|uniref:hypothetical protein n=1 Tax=Trichinella spiralis TaxID=6334 RepID=UPI0001EFEBAD|nr:conserved hypothetical protein [Trichinella spiralis]
MIFSCVQSSDQWNLLRKSRRSSLGEIGSTQNRTLSIPFISNRITTSNPLRPACHMQQYDDSEQSDVRTWRSLHLIHNCGKLVTQLEINSHLTSFQENRLAKEASSQEEEIQNNQGII